MTLSVTIPGRPEVRLDHLMLDVNGTFANRGALIGGVQPRVEQLRDRLTVHLGPEGASSAALRAADVVCATATDALDLLLDPTALSATLRVVGSAGT